MILDVLATQYAYILVILILGIGLYTVIACQNLIKKMIGLSMFQSAIFLFYVSTGYVDGGDVPVLHPHAHDPVTYASPLPHVIVLTAIVVGVAMTAVGMALIIRIYDEYDTVNEDILREVMAYDR